MTKTTESTSTNEISPTAESYLLLPLALRRVLMEDEFDFTIDPVIVDDSFERTQANWELTQPREIIEPDDDESRNAWAGTVLEMTNEMLVEHELYNEDPPYIGGPWLDGEKIHAAFRNIRQLLTIFCALTPTEKDPDLQHFSTFFFSEPIKMHPQLRIFATFGESMRLLFAKSPINGARVEVFMVPVGWECQLFLQTRNRKLFPGDDNDQFEVEIIGIAHSRKPLLKNMIAGAEKATRHVLLQSEVAGLFPDPEMRKYPGPISISGEFAHVFRELYADRPVEEIEMLRWEK